MVKISQILKAPRRTRRVAHIARTCAAHGLGYFVSRLGIQQHLPAWARLRNATPKEEPPDMPRRLANILEELGPTFVKFGQMMSSRPDLLPAEYIEELQRICHHVAPFPTSAARRIIEEDLDGDLEELFEDFSAEPLASGSIAQVHTARLHDGTEVVVKVRRPGIRRIIDDDLSIMQFLAEQGDKVEEFAPLRLPMLVDEFRQGIRREQNLLAEAAHTHHFYNAFEEDERMVVPRVFWDYCSSRVLTMQHIEGTFLSELEPEKEDPGLRKDLGNLILDRFLRMFFEIGSFHADPHMGNILVLPDRRIALLDFGLVGRLGDRLRTHLSHFMIALSNQQLELAADVLCEVGAVPPDVDEAEFQTEISAMLERHYNVPIEKIDLQSAFQEVMQVVRRYHIVMPRDFVLLGKALVTVGGVVTQLHPGIDAAQIARPYARRLVLGKFSPGSMKRSLTSTLYQVGMLLRNTPRDLRQLIRRLKAGAIEFSVDHRGLERYLVDLDRTGNRLALSIMLAAIVISSTSILTAGVGPKVAAFGSELSVLGILGYVFGFVLGVWLVIGIFRSGRI